MKTTSAETQDIIITGILESLVRSALLDARTLISQQLQTDIQICKGKLDVIITILEGPNGIITEEASGQIEVLTRQLAILQQTQMIVDQNLYEVSRDIKPTALDRAMTISKLTELLKKTFEAIGYAGTGEAETE